MGLKYNSGESSAIINAMQNNLKVSKDAVNGLNNGAQRITSALQGGSLSGQAYTAAKGLFEGAFIPTFKEVTSSLDKATDELNAYKQADGLVNHYGTLDEDNLNAQINEKKAQKFVTEALLWTYQNAMAANPAAPLLETLFNASRNLENLCQSLDNGIEKLQEKLKALHTFSDSTSSLFKNTLNDIKSVMNVVLFIGGGTFTSTGSFKIGKTKDVYDFSKAMISYKNGKVFLGGTKITREADGVLKWGNKFIYKPESNHVYGHGKDFGEESGIDLSKYHYSRLEDGSINWKELKNAGFEKAKGNIKDITGDFKGWKDVTTFGEGSGKLLGAAGTVITVGSDARQDFNHVNWSDGSSIAGAAGNLVVDAGVDLGTGAGAAGVGAAVGSLILPPLGTVVGAGAGIMVNWALSDLKDSGGKSVTDKVKDGMKGLGNRAEQYLSHVFW